MNIFKGVYGEEINITKNDNYTVMELTDEDGMVSGVCVDTDELIKAFEKAIKVLESDNE